MGRVNEYVCGAVPKTGTESLGDLHQVYSQEKISTLSKSVTSNQDDPYTLQ